MATETIVEEIALNLEEAAQATRRINVTSVSFLLGGIGVGIAVGFYLGHRWNTAQIRAEAFKKSEEEVEVIREVYRQKAVVAEPKPSVEEVVEERGYSPIENQLVGERTLRPPVPVFDHQGPLTREDIRKEKDEEWDYAKELAQRSPDHPYILHQDEFRGSETGYEKVVYTWYNQDGVLTDEDEDPLANPDDIVGMENLTKFGHGADDRRALFVRNEKMETEFEICYVDASYEETNEGLSNEQTD